MVSPARTSSRQLRLSLPQGHGGRRRGAGRKNRSGLQAHVARARFKPNEPVHVTLRLKEGLPSLRRKEIFQCLRASVRTARRKGFYVVHFSILSNHVHLILEPESNLMLAQMIQSLAIAFSKRLNSVLKRSGSVFRERYHLHVLRTPSEARHALAYVLANLSRHQWRRKFGNARQRHFVIAGDPFTSAYSFNRWRELLGKARVDHTLSNWSETYIELWYSEFVKPAQTWLLREGWARAAVRA